MDPDREDEVLLNVACGVAPADRAGTVVESNIHYPTDASLLWDTWRVASRLLVRAREIIPASVPHRFHNRKIKRLYLYVDRFAAQAMPVERVVRAVVHALCARRSKTRYPLGAKTWGVVLGLRFLPTGIRDRIVRRSLGMK